jgi:hypothetical protein
LLGGDFDEEITNALMRPAVYPCHLTPPCGSEAQPQSRTVAKIEMLLIAGFMGARGDFKPPQTRPA